MAMQFGRDERTGQLGYWDGQKFVPLGKTTIPQAAQGATGKRIDIDPSVPMTAEDQRMLQEFQKATAGVPEVTAPLPSERAAELSQAAGIAGAAAQDPRYMAEKQAEAKESLPELLKFAAANVAPAVLSGGGTALGAAAIKGGGLLARLARMTGGGAGGYAGEKVSQAAGLSEGDEGTAVASAVLGALPGFFKPKVKAVTADERRIQRLVGGEEVGAKAGVAGKTAEDLYALARAGGDISTDKLLKPLDDLINSARTTPNISGTARGEDFLARLEALRGTLVKRVLELKTRTTPGVPGTPGTLPPEIGGLPSIPGKEIAETLATPFDWLFKKAKPPIGTPGTPGIPPRTRVTGLKVKEEARQVSPENLVDDLKQLTNQKGLYREAENLGIPGLTQKLRTTYKEMAKEVPYLPEADVIYGQTKGLERGAKATRTSGAIGVENLLADPKLSGGLTTAQKAFLREQAMKSDKIGRISQALLQSPLGRSMLRLGVSDKGVVKPAAWSAALQIGARMAGLGEGERAEGY